MKHYIGIDLGTTNSAICSYDDGVVRVWKSPEQNDVTPSAIYIDKRSNRYYGRKAYNQAPYNPRNSATKFKRFMGTSMKFDFEDSKISLTPEECSAEVLKVLFGYLPEEIRNDPDTATVITVPAAFNQMKKDATLQAAKIAGIGKVALMQEPVAAIMSIMHQSKQEGIFLVYDLGGGTFDVSIAENNGGKVNLLAHDGIESCGGTDIDRMIFHKVVVPWLRENFSLPEDFLVNRKYKTFGAISLWATENAKIELSANEIATIKMSEMEARMVDEDGTEMYLDIDITRKQIDEITDDLVNRTVSVTREALKKAGLTSNDVERIVFVGGPTNYKPLRDKIAFELSLPGDIDVNPMTAVAEGASIFAESIDWTTDRHNRKATTETKQTDIDLTFKYTSRTPASSAKIACQLGSGLSGYTIEFTSLDTGWASGRSPLINNMLVELPLMKDGDNVFSAKIYDEFGREKSINVSEIVITKTLATIGSIPASHSIGVEVVDRLGGIPMLQFLINEGDALPKKGTINFKAGQTIKAGTNDSFNIKLWEGNIQSPINDNRFIGVMKIMGTDIVSGVVPTGADIECEYEMSDSGTINMEVSIPCIGASFNNRNFYSRQEGQLNIDDIDSIAEQGRDVLERIENICRTVNDADLDDAKSLASSAAELDSQEVCDPDDVQNASNNLLEAKRKISMVREANIDVIRKMELKGCLEFFDEVVRPYATPAEEHEFDSLVRSAEKAIRDQDRNFDNILDNMKTKNTSILIRQDWFIVDWYKRAVSTPMNYLDKARFAELKKTGDQALMNDDINSLRTILFELLSIQINSDSGEGMFDIANIVKG